MSRHCPGCCEVSHVSNGSTFIDHTKPNMFCPGCGHEAELSLLRAVAEAAKNSERILRLWVLPNHGDDNLHEAHKIIRDALVAWEKWKP